MTVQISKSNRVLSLQDRFGIKAPNSNFLHIDPLIGWVNQSTQVPMYGDMRRDPYLSTIWTSEPILAGAINVMVKRMRATGYNIEGGRNNAVKWARILQAADGGNGWQSFIDKWVLDYMTTDLGAIIEIGRSADDRPAGIYNLDSLKCYPWHEYKYPVIYTQPSGTSVKLKRQDVIHISDMTSAREEHRNKGFCAVSRVIKAGKTMLAIYDFELQKLGKLPPLAVAAIHGLTREQFLDSWNAYQKQREMAGTDVYSGIFWIGGEDPSVPVDIKLTDFASLPNGFERNTIIESWVKTIALNLGVDVGELWLIQHVGATKGSQTVQHQKALGKGTGEIHSMLEMSLNTRVLPADVTFMFDFQDDEQDRMSAEILGNKINNLIALYTQSSRGPANVGGLSAPFGRSGASNITSEPTAQTVGTMDQTPPLIDRDQAIELGIRWKVFPPELFGQEVTTVAGMILKQAGLYREDDQVIVTHDMKVHKSNPIRHIKSYRESAKLLLARLEENHIDILTDKEKVGLKAIAEQ